MPVYSIVVPVYQTEKYIAECIEIVLAQEEVSDWELILVDNGTKDNAAVICEEYAKKDSRIQVIHQENRRPGGGRNTGLRAATGEYVLFMDSDDMWEPNLLKTLEPLRQTQADILTFSFSAFYEEGKKIREYWPRIPAGENGRVFLQNLFDQNALPIPYPWSYAHRRKFLLANNLFYREDLCGPEDFELNMRAIPLAESIVGVDEPLYLFRTREDSATRTGKTARKSLVIQGNSVILAVYKKWPVPAVADYFAVNAARLGRFPKEEIRETLEEIKENRVVLENVPAASPRKAFVLLTHVVGVYYGAKLYSHLQDNQSLRAFLRKIRILRPAR